MASLADNLPYTQMPWDQTTWLAGLANEAQNAPRFKPAINGMTLPSYSGGLGSGVAGAAGAPGSPSPGVGGVLGGLNQVDQLINGIGGKGTVPAGMQGALGDANSLYGMYNAFTHPSLATGISGAAGAAHLYNQFAPALGGTALPGGITTGLGGAGDIAGIYNAFKNPTPGNIASGLYDAHNLYGIGHGIMNNMALNSAITTGLDPLATSAAGIGDLSAAPGLADAMSGAATAGSDMAAGALGGAEAGAAGAGTLGTLGAGAYSSSPAVLEAMNATIPDAAGAGAGAAGSGLGQMSSYLGPIGATVGFLFALNDAINQDKQASSPMGQMSVLAQNGPLGNTIANSMVNLAAKYGDPKNPASWDETKWSPADLASINYGHVTLPGNQRAIAAARRRVA